MNTSRVKRTTDPFRYFTNDQLRQELLKYGIHVPISFSKQDLKSLLEANFRNHENVDGIPADASLNPTSVLMPSLTEVSINNDNTVPVYSVSRSFNSTQPSTTSTILQRPPFTISTRAAPEQHALTTTTAVDFISSSCVSHIGIPISLGQGLHGCHRDVLPLRPGLFEDSVVDRSSNFNSLSNSSVPNSTFLSLNEENFRFQGQSVSHVQNSGAAPCTTIFSNYMSSVRPNFRLPSNITPSPSCSNSFESGSRMPIFNLNETHSKRLHQQPVTGSNYNDHSIAGLQIPRTYSQQITSTVYSQIPISHNLITAPLQGASTFSDSGFLQTDVPAVYTSSFGTSQVQPQHALTAPVCEFPPECNYPAMLNLTSCSCFCAYEEHQDPSKFFVVIPNFPVKIPMSCSATLVWDQQLCTCVLPSVIETTVEDVYANAVDCTVLTDLRSDGMEFKNFDGYYTKKENGAPILLESVPGAVDGKAARFEGNSLYLAVFEYNDLTSTSFFKLRVNPDDSNQTYADNNQYLLSDACPGHPNAATELIYNPTSGNFTLKMRTAYNSQATCEGVAPNVDGWFDISISVSNGETSWSINDFACPILGGTGNIYNSKCGLTLGGNPMTDSDAQDFYGYIDSVKVIKHCSAEPVPISA